MYLKNAMGFIGLGTITNKYKLINTFVILSMTGSMIYLFLNPLEGDVLSSRNLLVSLSIFFVGLLVSVLLTELSNRYDLATQEKLIELQMKGEILKQERLIELQVRGEIAKQKQASIDASIREVNLLISQVKKGETVVFKGEKIIFGQYVYGKIRVRGGILFMDIYIDNVKESTRKIS